MLKELLFSFLNYCNVLTIRAGLPHTTVWGGTSLETTEPAPITAHSPIVTPFSIILRAPIKTLSPMIIGALFVFSFLLYNLSSQLIGCESVSLIKQPEPIRTLLPMVTEVVAHIVEPDIPTLSPIIILLFGVEMLKMYGCIKPIEFDNILLLHLKLFPMIISPFLVRTRERVNKFFLMIFIFPTKTLLRFILPRLEFDRILMVEL